MNAEINNIKRHRGVAGQFSVSASVQYPGESAETVTFVGNAYGGPIVMVTPAAEVFVSSRVTERIGSILDESWIRRFFAESGE